MKRSFQSKFPIGAVFSSELAAAWSRIWRISGPRPLVSVFPASVTPRVSRRAPASDGKGDEAVARGGGGRVLRRRGCDRPPPRRPCRIRAIASSPTRSSVRRCRIEQSSRPRRCGLRSSKGSAGPRRRFSRESTSLRSDFTWNTRAHCAVRRRDGRPGRFVTAQRLCAHEPPISVLPRSCTRQSHWANPEQMLAPLSPNPVSTSWRVGRA
jgi:hypothetical protein